MFDIDGTLSSTHQVDADCYLQALSVVFGFQNIDPDWSVYRYVSDSGILDEIFWNKVDHPPEEREIAHFKIEFLHRLQEAAENNPSDFSPLPGASEMWKQILNLNDIAVALASGGWQHTAEFKLKLARLHFDRLPAAFANHAFSREEIMRISCQRALWKNRVDAFDSIIYVGDGVWDVHAAKNLGYQFIGIAPPQNQARLKKAGAEHVIEDYRDLPSFLKLVESL